MFDLEGGADLESSSAKRRLPLVHWWARQDSNLQPDRYERPALTIELQAPPALPLTRQVTVPTPLTGWPPIPHCRVTGCCYSTEPTREFDHFAPVSVSSATSL